MGFPLGYTGLCVSKLLFHFITLLEFVRMIIASLLASVGVREPNYPGQTQADGMTELRSFSAHRIREHLPLVNPPDSCAVCLYEFQGRDDVPRLRNCRHIFHRSCLDRWIDHDQKTCPLCRTPLIPDDSFNRRR